MNSSWGAYFTDKETEAQEVNLSLGQLEPGFPSL